MSGPWDKYASAAAPLAGPWERYAPQGDPEFAELATEDIRGRLPSARPEMQLRLSRELEFRAAQETQPRRPGQRPDEFDVRSQNQNFRDWRAERSWADAAKETAAFVASAPVRMATRGQYGAGDVAEFLAPGTGTAIASREADFSRAHPDLMWGLGAAGEVAGGLPGAASIGRASGPRSAAAAVRAERAAEDAASAQRLSVAVPGFAYNQGPTASVAKQLSETPIIGQPTRNAIETGLRETARTADDVATRYGDARTSHQVGQIVDDGLRRFKDARPADVLDDAARNLTDEQLGQVIAAPARDTSLKAKQAALYDRAWRQIPEPMRQGRALTQEPRMLSGPGETRAVLREIVGRNQRMTVADPNRPIMPVQGGLLGRMMEAIDNPRWVANLQTLRDMRSELRRLASGMSDTERNVLKQSDLERLQSALTRDMIGQLQRNADAFRQAGNIERATAYERAIRQFARADRFTRLSMQRLETIERLFNASSAEALARNIVTAAQNRSRGNLELLRTLRRTLRPEEMNQIAGHLIRSLGAPVGSARGMTQDIGFSVASFMTRWESMEPAARSILFDGPHRQAIDDLVRVVNRMANIEALANTSRTGTNTLNVGAVLGAGGAVATGAIDTLTAGLGAAGAGFGAAYLMSRPAYARWMVRHLQAKARRRRGLDRNGAAIAESIRQLTAYAEHDPNLSDVLAGVRDDERVNR